VPYAIERYTKETNRLYGVLDRRLADRAFVAGGYSIADIACYPWIMPHEAHGQDLGDFPHLKRWFETIAARAATIRAYEGTTDTYSRTGESLSDEARRVLFGQTATSLPR
jgi:GST-like protein